MPIPATEQFTPELWELVKHVERSLHHIARKVETREQAIIVKRDLLTQQAEHEQASEMKGVDIVAQEEAAKAAAKAKPAPAAKKPAAKKK